MKFAGFTPQQQHVLLSKMGYNGPPREEDMENFMMSNPQAAAGLGKMALVAQKRIENRIKASKGLPETGEQGFAEGGLWDQTVQHTVNYGTTDSGDPLYTLYKTGDGSSVLFNNQTGQYQQDGTWVNPDQTQQNWFNSTGNQTDFTQYDWYNPVAGGSDQAALDAAQQAYSDALASGDANAIQQAQDQLTLTQQAYNASYVPGSNEILAQTLSNPLTETTTANVQTIQPTDDQLIAAGTGQQTTPYSAKTYSPPNPEDVVAQEAATTTAEAAPRTDANVYEATKIGDEVSQTLQDIEAAKADPSAGATVRGQLEMLMADFEDGTPPWASGAMRQATAIMQKRGMGASSMAGEAIVLAAMQAALPIASADAATVARFELQNLNNEQQMTIFKAQQQMAALFSDQAAENAAKQFNAQSQNQTDQFFAGLETTVSQFNAAQINAIAQFNAEQNNVVSRFNVEQQVTTDLFRAKQRDAMSQFNAQLKQQRDQFNAENDLIIAQANAQWLQKISTINTAEQNLANREAAQVANSLTTRAIDQLYQYERDIMAYAWKSAESSQDRALKLLLADKDLQASREALDADKEAAWGQLLYDIAFG